MSTRGRGRGRAGAAAAAGGAAGGAADSPAGRGRGKVAQKRPREEELGSPKGEAAAAVNPAVKDGLLTVLGQHPQGLTPDELEKMGIGEPDALMYAINAVLAERVVGVFAKKDATGNSQHVLRLVSGEQHLAGLSCVPP